MRRLSPGLAALVLLGASACGGEPDVAETPETETAAEASAPSSEAPPPPAAAATDEAAATDAAAREAVAAAPGAPPFAVIYPGGRIEGADEEDGSGPGGLVTYVTTATPDEVIAFHRTRAEAEGLASVMAMNQGEARAYGAHSTRNGANLSVFATPVENGVSVQLVWSAGG